MKRVHVLVLVGILLGLPPAKAQHELKIGHTNVLEILEALPETDSAQRLIDQDTKELELMLEDMQVEYNKLLKDYQDNIDSYSELVRSTKESDIVEMQNRIQTFQQNASKQLQQRGAELMQPIYDKIQHALESIGLNEGYAYILDTSKGGVVYTGESSTDLGPLLRRELGIATD